MDQAPHPALHLVDAAVTAAGGSAMAVAIGLNTISRART
jgi:hypothetical protein